MQERVQKFISAAGAASRRKAEEFIKSGQVFINGRKAKLGDKVDPQKDEVKVYGKIVKPAEEKIYIALNKPKGCVVSRKDPQGRKTVFDLLPKDLRAKIWNVGRLDFDTEGLLILTNDGELTQQLSHPSFEHEKEYEVSVQEKPKESQIETLKSGIELETGMTHLRSGPDLPRSGDIYSGSSAVALGVVRTERASVWTRAASDALASLRSPSEAPRLGGGSFTYPAKIKIRDDKILITIHEGKNRQIKRMFDKVGLTVKNLKRIRINKLKLPETLPLGGYKMIKKSDII